MAVGQGMDWTTEAQATDNKRQITPTTKKDTQTYKTRQVKRDKEREREQNINNLERHQGKKETAYTEQ